MGNKKNAGTRPLRTPISIYKVVSCLLEYKQLVQRRQGKHLRGISALAQRYETTTRTIKGWARLYAKDMELFSMDQITLLHKLSLKEERLYRLNRNYNRIRATSGNTRSTAGNFMEEMNMMTEQVKMFRDLYNDVRGRLDRSKRANRVNQALLVRARQRIVNLRQHTKCVVPCTQDKLPYVNDADHGNSQLALYGIGDM